MPEVTPNADALRKRMRRLVEVAESSTDGALAELRKVGKLAIFGGAVRDVARRGVAAFRSDLDIVLYDSDRSRFIDLVRSLNGRANRFGGYRLPLPAWHLDVWLLEDTWASTAGHTKVSKLADLLHCTFFSCDAAVFDIENGSLFFSADYLEQLRRSWVELNLSENPNPTGALVRAIRRGILWRAHFGPRLQDFVCRQFKEEDWNTLVRIDEAAFPNPILRWCNEEELLPSMCAGEIWRAAHHPLVVERKPQQLPLPI